MGDVILSLPAFRAVREKFPKAKITALVGKASAEIIELSGFFDEKIAVDRVKLRDSGKIWSIREILKLAFEIRSRKFDFIIDLHSLSETNLLGFFSGAKHRLYINRENRSLDFLGSFKPAPPPEDKTKHATDRYLDALKPLEIEKVPRFVEVEPRREDLDFVEKLFEDVKIKQLVGFFPGAGHESRRWRLEKFAELAKILSKNEELQVVVFLGPEEEHLRMEVEEKFPERIKIVEKLSLLRFMAALSRLRVFVGNDTGATHLGALVGVPVVLIIDKRAPETFVPLSAKTKVIKSKPLDEISVKEVLQATREILDNKKAEADKI